MIQSISGGVFQHTEKCTVTLNTKIWRLTDKLKAYVSSIKHAIIVLDNFLARVFSGLLEELTGTRKHKLPK